MMDILRSGDTDTFFSYDDEAAEDEFERRRFSDRLARIIMDEKGGKPLVVSIVNPWGGGKSTLLKYIRDAIAATTRDESPNVKNCRITRFNLWRYAGEDQLLYRMFESLIQAINQETPLTTGQHLLKLLPAWIKRFSIACDLLAPGSGGLLREFFATLSPEQFEVQLDTVRHTTREYLARTGTRVIMLLDDVDRLDPDEILLLFRALKLIADLPNTTFIIAMDEEHVSEVIGQRIGGSIESGRRYIEKIVNVRLVVPKIPDEVLEDYVMRRFITVWRRELKERAERATAPGTAQQAKPPEPDPQDVERMIGIFRVLHLPYLPTPRTVKSIENAFAFALGLLPDEVNAGDVLLLEATRLLHPQLYLALPEVIPNLNKITSNSPIEFIMDESAESERVQKQKADIVRQLSDLIKTSTFHSKDQIKEALTTWFPQLRSFHSEDEEKTNDQAKRISSPNYFWRYYSGAVHKKDVHDADVSSWLTQALDPEKKSQAAKALAHHLGKLSFQAFFKKLQDLLFEIPDSTLPLTLMAEVVSAFPEENTDHFSNLWQRAASTMAAIIHRMAPKEQVMIATTLVRASKNFKWSFVFMDHVAKNNYLTLRAKEGEEQRPPSPFDEELAKQSIAAYEGGFIPQSNDLICKMVWTLYRNRHLPNLTTRVRELSLKTPEVGLQFLAAGCDFGSSESHKAACWIWVGEKGLRDVERLLSMPVLKKVLKTLPEKPANYEPFSLYLDYLTLEEVGWACLRSLREQEKVAKDAGAAATE
ncbi:MAG: P-loop NTPase fold protein [Verrucomicrobiota bacterium]